MRGFDLSPGRDKVVLERRLIESYVTRDFVALAPDMPIGEAKARLLGARCHEGYVVDADGVYLGEVTLAEIVASEEGGLPGETTAARLAKRDGLFFTPKTSVWGAMERMGDYVGESIPVVEDGGPRLLGVVFEAAIVRACLDAMKNIRSEEHAGG